MRRALEPCSLLCFAIMAALVFATKSFYSTATADQLSWILAPTAHLVGLIVGADFVFEAGTGWLSRGEMFVIAPECAGLNFMLAAFLTLAVAAVLRVPSWRAQLASIPLAMLGAYLATLVVNTLRISLSLRASSLGSSLATGEALHRVQGIVVFFVSLYLLHVAMEYFLARYEGHAR